MKPLKLQRTTLRNLSESELTGAAGGTNTTTTAGGRSLPVRCGESGGIIACDSRVDRCPSGMCPPPVFPTLPDPIP